MDLPSIINVVIAAATLGIAVITYSANKTIKKIYEYTNRQSDRKIIEDILALQESACHELFKSAKFYKSEPLAIFTKARELAVLYGLKDIQLHIEKMRALYGKGYVMHHEIWDENGARINVSREVNFNLYHQMIAQMYTFNADIKCYQNYLKVYEA